MVIPAYVLAGGRSQRMGQDKALVEIDGVPLAARTAQVLSDGGCGPVHLVGLQAELEHLGWPVIRTEAAEQHPLYGVVAALSDCRHPLALICPCDLIALTGLDVAKLLNQSGPCVAFAAGQVHPLLAVLPTDLAPRALALADANRSAQALVEGIPRIELGADPLFDANHPHDLQHFGNQKG